MVYYLVYVKGTPTAPIYSSWDQARRSSSGVKGSWCKRFETRQDASRTLAATCTQEQEQHQHPPAASKPVPIPDGALTQSVFADGRAVLGKRSACAVVFMQTGRVVVEAQEEGPHTAPRAELQALLLALKEDDVRDAILYTPSSFATEAFERGFPVAWSHQDLMIRIACLCAERRCVIRRDATVSASTIALEAKRLCRKVMAENAQQAS